MKLNYGYYNEDWVKMKLSDYIVDVGCSIVSAMERINQNAKGIVYITQSNKLVGTLTDGDVRRYIIKRGDIAQNITSIMNVKPLYLRIGDERRAHSYMLEKSIRSLPIIDLQGRIVKIVFEDGIIEEKKEIDIPVVIMAGGKGTRLYPYTQILPKPLIPIGDKTITEHIMDRFRKYGCDMFTMIINYKKHFIKSYFDDIESDNEVKFVEESEFRGTGGGLKLLQNSIKSPFFMSNCDILIEADYYDIFEYHKKNNNIITMVCAEKKMTIPYGIVEIAEDGKVDQIKEKPEYSFLTNTGFYVIDPKFLDFIPKDTFIHITDVIKNCIQEKENVGVYKIHEDNWLDMGQLDELEKMKERLNM